jgi:hypothetical protein
LWNVQPPKIKDVSIYVLEYDIEIHYDSFFNCSAFLFNKMIKSHNINPSGRQKKTIIVYDKGELFPSLRVREGR